MIYNDSDGTIPAMSRYNNNSSGDKNITPYAPETPARG